jgi:hypothetical protein
MLEGPRDPQFGNASCRHRGTGVSPVGEVITRMKFMSLTGETPVPRRATAYFSIVGANGRYLYGACRFSTTRLVANTSPPVSP